jgi:proteasome lid subunit RPN8/RPN11
MPVVLPPGLRDAMLAAAREAAPYECCGLIEGARDGGLFRITALHPARNLSAAATRFEIDPADHIAAQKAARARGMAIVGCYHSHPGGRAEPSAADLAGAGEENFLWLIVAEGGVAAFVYSAGLFGRVTGADWVTSSA